MNDFLQLKGRRIVIFGVANRKSVAYHIGKLLREAGAEVVECAFVIALPDLGGIERLEKLGCSVRFLCEFAGD